VRGNKVRLQDILEAIEKVERYADQGHGDLESDELPRLKPQIVAILRDLQQEI
jgi:uncharacterized protein with HEPN domain